MQEILELLVKTLIKDKRLVSENNLLKNKIIELALKHDEKLISDLLIKKKLKETFFTKINDVLVFNIDKFISFVNNKDFLPDSYTSFKNKIGLMSKKQYFSETTDVVLVWPFKDCVLEGGQSKEDEIKNEIFYNETLAPDEIDRLLDAKVLTNFKRFNANGRQPISEFRHTDNFIINGNNLLVLHSLKKRFLEKVKLIYIDPPYNTGNDGFNYNDRFNHSTWLTFMKNRLEVAKELLRKDGAIFVQIDHHEIFYLGIIMDEIFGKDNFVQLISVKVAAPAGFKTVNPGPVDVTEYILFYTKNKQKFNFKKMYVPGNYDENYRYFIKNFDKDVSNWELVDIKDIIYKKIGISNWREAKEKFGDSYKIVIEEMMSNFALENSEKVVRLCDPHKASGKLKELIEKSKKEKGKIFHHERDNYTDFYIMNGGLFAFYSNKIGRVDGELTPTILLTDFWDDIAWEGIQNEGYVKFKNAKKPEKLLKRIIEMSTEKNDLVLDFFLGSGTTCAVAQKLNRQYIGIEQLDYGENSAVKRMENVIGRADSKGRIMELIVDYDTSGISKSIDWKGGGSFVYCELKELNEYFVKKIHKAKDTKTILEIWTEMKEKAFLSYRVNPMLFDINTKEFNDLSIKHQKKLLIECLDFNNLYVNKSEIEDEQYKISKKLIELNKQFYGVL